jgi:hypothetical protein
MCERELLYCVARSTRFNQERKKGWLVGIRWHLKYSHSFCSAYKQGLLHHCERRQTGLNIEQCFKLGVVQLLVPGKCFVGSAFLQTLATLKPAENVFQARAFANLQRHGLISAKL